MVGSRTDTVMEFCIYISSYSVALTEDAHVVGPNTLIKFTHIQSLHEARGKVSMHTLWIQIYSNRNTSNEIKHLCNSQSVPIDAWNN